MTRSGFLPKHSNEILHNWQQIGILGTVGHNEQKIRKGAFYIAYNYFKDVNDRQKVEFRIK